MKTQWASASPFLQNRAILSLTENILVESCPLARERDEEFLFWRNSLEEHLEAARLENSRHPSHPSSLASHLQ